MDRFKQTLKQRPIVLVYFSYPNCSVCKVLRPKVEALVAGWPEVGFEYIDTHEHPEIAGQYTVFSVPTLLIFVEGRESKRFSRNFSIDEVRGFIERMLGLMAG